MFSNDGEIAKHAAAEKINLFIIRGKVGASSRSRKTPTLLIGTGKNLWGSRAIAFFSKKKGVEDFFSMKNFKIQDLIFQKSHF